MKVWRINAGAARVPRAPAGFTLVELLVAMAILAIGIMAMMAMQYSSLAGSMISRDNSGAADVGQRVIELMELESQQWRSGAPGTGLSTVDSSHAGRASLLKATFDSNWDWGALFDAPVDARLTPTSAARFCVYSRGGALRTVNLVGTGSGPATTSDSEELLIVHVAVLFPSANQVFAGGACPGAATISTGLNAEIAPDQADPEASYLLQLEGWRVQFFGTQISRRDYLDVSPVTPVTSGQG